MVPSNGPASGASGKRRHHKKSKTGCVTCKIRRVKCDEQWPACRRCLSTGRRCDGYENQTELLGDKDDALVPFCVPLSPPKPLAEYRTPMESRSLEYFQYRTLAALCGFNDPGEWTSLLVRVSDSEPAIRHAMVALSAFHERCETFGVPLLEDEDGLGKPSKCDAFALQQYTRAMRLIRQRLTHGEQSPTVTLLSCILFICLEFLRGNKTSAITHLRSGLQIIRACLPNTVPNNNLRGNLADPSMFEGNLVPLFSRLSILQSLYGQPRGSEYGPNGQGPFVEMLDMDLGPARLFFSDLNEARMSAVNITNSTLRLAFMIDYNYFPGDDAMWATQIALLEQSKTWCRAHDMLVTTLSDEELPYARLLAAHVYMSQIWILSAPERVQCAFDNHLGIFHRIYDSCLPLIERLEAISSRQPSFTLDSGLLSTLFFATLKCRHRVFRRKLCALLQRAPHREGLWKGSEVVKVAEMIMLVEETSIHDQPSAMYPPEYSRVHDLDIQSRRADDLGRQLIRLKIKPDDSADFIWTTRHIQW